MKRLRSNLLLNLFIFTGVVAASLFLIATNQSQAAPATAEVDTADGANTIYLPSLFAADDSAALQPMTPDSYVSDSEEMPNTSIGAVQSTTHCSTYVKVNNAGVGAIQVFWENPYGQEILYKTLDGDSHYWQQTYVSQKWRMRDSRGTLLTALTVDACSYIDVTVEPRDSEEPTPVTEPTSVEQPTPTPVPLCTGHISIIKFWDNETGKVVPGYDPITDGATVDVDTLPGNFYLRANPIGHDIASLEFNVNGVIHVDNDFPFGYPESEADWDPAPGRYTVTVTAYSEPDGQGEICDQETVTFTIVDLAPTPTAPPLCTGHISIVKFWDNDIDGVVPGYEPITDGTIVSTDTLPPNFYLRANPIGHDIASLEFIVNDDLHVDNDFPFGYPESEADWDPAPGVYVVTVTAYSQPNGQGEICDQEHLTFTIVEPDDTPAPTATSAPVATGVPTATAQPTETAEPTVTPEPSITPDGPATPTPQPGPNDDTCIGDLVWQDLDADGLQDAGEPGIVGADIWLGEDTTGDGRIDRYHGNTQSDDTGAYLFCGLDSSLVYSVEFVPVSGCGFALPDVGSDDTIDSDANISKGVATGVVVIDGQINDSIDVGFVCFE